MKKLVKITGYVLKDVFLARWNLGFLVFYAISAIVLMHFNGQISKAIVSLLNVSIILIPLISAIMGSMYLYNSRDFVQLLLSQPVKRSHVFLGLLFGLIIGLCLSIAIALGLGFAYSAIVGGQDVAPYLSLILYSVLLCPIFTSISFLVALRNEDKVRGIAYSLLIWFFLAILYDGFFLLWLIIFQDYPLENHALVMTFLNPVDLVRISILLEVDMAAMMGYTGAVFSKSLGGMSGLLSATAALSIWIIVPIAFIIRTARKRDF